MGTLGYLWWSFLQCLIISNTKERYTKNYLNNKDKGAKLGIGFLPGFTAYLPKMRGFLETSGNGGCPLPDCNGKGSLPRPGTNKVGVL